MENLIGKWGGIPIKRIKDGDFNNLIYPEDIILINNIQQPVVEIIGVYEDYLIIKSEKLTCRINPIIVQVCEKPDFFVNDEVVFYNTKGSLEFGIITDLYRHTKRNKYIYIVEVNGKIKGRRYYVADLQKVKE